MPLHLNKRLKEFNKYAKDNEKGVIEKTTTNADGKNRGVLYNTANTVTVADNEDDNEQAEGDNEQAEDDNEQDNGTSTEHECMFRIGTNTIMLLKGAAAAGKFDVMTKRLKGVYRDAAKGVAKTNDLNRFYDRLHRLSKDEVSFMEMVFYREIADETPRLKEKILDQMFKCRIGSWLKDFDVEKKKYVVGNEGRTWQDNIAIDIFRGSDNETIRLLPCRFYETMYDKTLDMFEPKDMKQGNFSETMNWLKESIAIEVNGSDLEGEDREDIVKGQGDLLEKHH